MTKQLHRSAEPYAIAFLLGVVYLALLLRAVDIIGALFGLILAVYGGTVWLRINREHWGTSRAYTVVFWMILIFGVLIPLWLLLQRLIAAGF